MWKVRRLASIIINYLNLQKTLTFLLYNNFFINNNIRGFMSVLGMSPILNENSSEYGALDRLCIHNNQNSKNNLTKISHKILDRIPDCAVAKLSGIAAGVTMCAGIALTLYHLSYNKAFSIYCINLVISALAGVAVNLGVDALISKKNKSSDADNLSYADHIELRTIRNSHKNKNKPTALIIQAAEDHNGAFTSSRLFSYQHLTKKYKFHKIIVSDTPGVLKAIKEIGRHEKISLLWIRAHGDPTYILLGREPKGPGIKEENLYGFEFGNLLKDSLTEDAITLLDSCSTGTPIEGIKNFASRFSIAAPGRVFAAKEILYDRSFSSDGIPSLKDISGRDITVVYENGEIVDPIKNGKREHKGS